jgi:predicted transcriptional regulator
LGPGEGIALNAETRFSPHPVAYLAETRRTLLQERLMAEVADSQELIELSSEIVAAYVGHNAVSAADLPKLISEVFAALKSLGGEAIEAEGEAPKPAVTVRRSITPDHLVCLEDGKKFKSLKRHLMTHHQLSPDQYREKWSLPADYPMVAPNYSATRSSLAKTSGLGRKAAPLRRGRKPATASA